MHSPSDDARNNSEHVFMCTVIVEFAGEWLRFNADVCNIRWALFVVFKVNIEGITRASMYSFQRFLCGFIHESTAFLGKGGSLENVFVAACVLWQSDSWVILKHLIRRL
jgi:hypothetical protein